MNFIPRCLIVLPAAFIAAVFLDPYHLRFSPDMKWLVIAGNRLNHVDIYRWDAICSQYWAAVQTKSRPSLGPADARTRNRGGVPGRSPRQ